MADKVIRNNSKYYSFMRFEKYNHSTTSFTRMSKSLFMTYILANTPTGSPKGLSGTSIQTLYNNAILPLNSSAFNASYQLTNENYLNNYYVSNRRSPTSDPIGGAITNLYNIISKHLMVVLRWFEGGGAWNFNLSTNINVNSCVLTPLILSSFMNDGGETDNPDTWNFLKTDAIVGTTYGDIISDWLVATPSNPVASDNNKIVVKGAIVGDAVIKSDVATNFFNDNNYHEIIDNVYASYTTMVPDRIPMFFTAYNMTNTNANILDMLLVNLIDKQLFIIYTTNMGASISNTNIFKIYYSDIYTLLQGNDNSSVKGFVNGLTSTQSIYCGNNTSYLAPNKFIQYLINGSSTTNNISWYSGSGWSSTAGSITKWCSQISAPVTITLNCTFTGFSSLIGMYFLPYSKRTIIYFQNSGGSVIRNIFNLSTGVYNGIADATTSLGMSVSPTTSTTTTYIDVFAFETKNSTHVEVYTISGYIKVHIDDPKFSSDVTILGDAGKNYKIYNVTYNHKDNVAVINFISTTIPAYGYVLLLCDTFTISPLNVTSTKCFSNGDNPSFNTFTYPLSTYTSNEKMANVFYSFDPHYSLGASILRSDMGARYYLTTIRCLTYYNKKTIDINLATAYRRFCSNENILSSQR